ncbi:MAG: LPS export ABC transporter periplasmic protein LptC [Gemmatimonadaceae bacterium]|nr:LPS export ABC transporter periplasmic protein LptC [Gemmatimonadaceae bacterium]
MTRRIILFLALLGGACADLGGAKPARKITTEADTADQIAFKSRTIITDRGVMRAEVLSDTALFFNESTRVHLRRLNGVFYNSTGAKDAVMTSRWGIYDTRLGVLEAHGDVEVISVDGRRLRSPEVRFDQRTNQITSDSAFVLTEPDREVRGIGFVSDPDMNNIRVLKAAKGKAGTFTIPGT